MWIKSLVVWKWPRNYDFTFEQHNVIAFSLSESFEK